MRYFPTKIAQWNKVVFASLVVSLLAPLAANAASVVITRVSGASNYIEPQTADANPIIYGSVIGAATGTCTPGGFCNNCTGIQACSERRIQSSTVLQIDFTVTIQTAGYIFLAYSNGGTITPLSAGTEFTRSTDNPISSGDSGYVRVNWGVICGYLTDINDTTCSTVSVNKSLYIAISPDTNIDTTETTLISVKMFAPTDTTGAGIDAIDCTTGQDGVCQFVAYPGDEKVYIEDIRPSGTYPTVNTVPVQFVRVYINDNQGDLVTNINYATPTYADLPIDNDGAVNPNMVEGLVNETYYGFKLAIVDQAYNIAYLTSNDQIAEECGLNLTIGDDSQDANCVYIAKPSNVIGLLEDDFNCFISTAAYGSSFAPKVKTFRAFRDRYLIRTEWGQKFVLNYYKYGPMAARTLHEHPWLKPLVRAVLWPVWAFAATALWLDDDTLESQQRRSE